MKKLHVGCGPAPIAGWINTDINPASPDILAMDASSPWPFLDNDLDYVFSEHLIEHLTYADGLFFLTEAHRCLKPGGVLRVATPDIRFLFKLYQEWGKTATSNSYVEWASSAFICHNVVHPVLVINNFFRDWGHQFLWDPSLLELAMRDAAKFSSVRQCEVHCSEDANLVGLEQHGQWIPTQWNVLETMVFEATK